MRTLALTEQGLSLHADGELLLVQRGDAVVHRARAEELDQLLVFGRIELSSGALALLLRRGIDCVLLTSQGSFRGRVVGRGSRNAALRLAQLHRAAEPDFCLRFARAVVAAKIKHQREVLLRAQRRLQDEPLANALGQLRLLQGRAEQAESLDVLRGFEGQAAAEYFGQFDKLLRNDQFRFERRSRRPPRDPVNACLSFGYAVLGSVLETEILRCGLDPQLGFFHQPDSGRPSLMLDLLEEFRPLVDQLVLRVVNRRQLGPGDFDRRTGQSLAEILVDQPPQGEPTEPIDILLGESPPANPAVAAPPWADAPPAPSDADSSAPDAEPPPRDQAAPIVGVYLNATGRKVFLTEFFHRLRERMFYAPRDASLEFRDIVREQIYHLARVIEQKQPDYVPFIPS